MDADREGGSGGELDAARGEADGDEELLRRAKMEEVVLEIKSLRRIISAYLKLPSWDAVVTCFFLDTAHNIVEYVEIISKILKDGGVWINVGPLLYHFAEAYSPEDEMSIELSLEDVKRVVLHYGFKIEVEKTIETTYTTNPCSMMQNRYFTVFWTMKKTTQE